MPAIVVRIIENSISHLECHCARQVACRLSTSSATRSARDRSRSSSSSRSHRGGRAPPSRLVEIDPIVTIASIVASTAAAPCNWGSWLARNVSMLWAKRAPIRRPSSWARSVRTPSRVDLDRGPIIRPLQRRHAGCSRRPATCRCAAPLRAFGALSRGHAANRKRAPRRRRQPEATQAASTLRQGRRRWRERADGPCQALLRARRAGQRYAPIAATRSMEAM